MSDEWYPDPLGRADLRRHDGARWTHDVSNDGVRSTERLGLPLPRREPTDAAVEPPPPATEALPETPVRPTPSPSRLTAPRHAPYVPDAPLGNYGLLIASGVLAILTGAITLFLGISALSATTTNFGCVSAQVCGTPTAILDPQATAWSILLILLGAALGAGGVGTCMAKRWGRTTVVVMCTLSVLFYVILIFANLGDRAAQNNGSVVLIPIIWFGLIGGMALVGGGIG